MRFDELLLEYDRGQTVKNFGEKVLAAASKDQSIDFAGVLSAYNPENINNYRLVLQKSPEAQQAMIEYVMGVIEQADPTKNKNYSQAIARLYGMGNTLLEDIASTLSQYLIKFDKLKNKKKIPAPYNDFMRYKSLDEFMTVVEQLPDPDSEVEQQKVGALQVPPDVEYEVIYGSFDQGMRITSDCVVLIPKNKQAGYWWAKEYPKKGVTNRWCTAWEGDNSRFDYYSKQGPLYIIIPAKRKDDNEKYQFHFVTKQFMDYQDHQIGDSGMSALAERFPALTQVFRRQAIEYNIYALMTPEFKAAVKDYAVTAGNQLDELLAQYAERIANFGFSSLSDYGINLPEGAQEALIEPIMVYLEAARKALSAKGGFWDRVRDSLGSERDENKIEVFLNTDSLLKGAMENSRAGGLVAKMAEDPSIARKIDASHLQDLLLRDPLFRFIMRQVPKLYKEFLEQLEAQNKQSLSEDTGLTFMGSPCTKDCSGHQAGYKWSLDRNGRVANGHSNSFNNGTNIAADVSKKRKQGGGKLPGYVSQTKDAIRKRAARAFGKTTLGQDENLQEDGNNCPPATQDITLNLENRQKAIDEYGYGPLNPDLPNTKFWMKKADEWNLDNPEEAKQSLCGNCAAFDQRQETLDCIAQGIDSDQGADDPTIEAGDLGYCRFLKFKCASRRTCDAWVTGGPLTDKEELEEKWTQKYKDSINCSNPKGFSQKAHCAGKKKHNESVEEEMTCPHCGGALFSEMMINEKKDACYYKVKSRYKVWPSAYASGALVKCRKKGASNWGNKSESIEEQLDESLRDWFTKEKWVRMDTKGNIKGPCAREPGEGKPKCLPQAKAHALGKKGRASAAQRKRREDPNPERRGPAINVNTKKKTSEDMTEATFNSKQEVIDHFVKQGKSAAAGAAAWERGYRGTKPTTSKPLKASVRSYHDDLDDKRYGEQNMTEGRAYYNVIGTTDDQLKTEFGMSKDAAGWYLKENVDKKKHANAFRAFGAPKLKEFNMAAFSGEAATQGPDNVVGPLTKQIKRK